MCDPISIGAVTAALSVGQAVLSYEGQRQAYNVNEDAANLNYAQEINVNEQKRVQLDAERSEKAFDTAITAAQAEGRIAASASERGLGSSSIIQAINADMFGIGRQASVEGLNDQNARNQLALERGGAEISRASSINSMQKPGALSLVLGVGQGVMKGVNAYTGSGGKFGKGGSN